MNKRDHKILRRDKRNLEKRIERKQFKDQPKPIFKGCNIFYQISDRIRAIGCGGIGAIHMLVRKLKLDRRINDSLALLKVSSSLPRIGPCIEHRLQCDRRWKGTRGYRAFAQ